MEKSRSKRYRVNPKGRKKNYTGRVGKMPVPDITKISEVLLEPEVPFKAPNGYYFETLLRWLFQNKVDQRKLKRRHLEYPGLFEATISEDYEIKHRYFPPDPDEKVSTVKYSPILMDELSENNADVQNRRFPNAPTHSVFLVCILESLRAQPIKFISMFADHMNVKEFLKERLYAGELKIISLLKDKLQEFINDNELQLIPYPLYHHNCYGYQMSESAIPMKHSDLIFEFGFSKTSSDNFTKSIIEILIQRKNLLNILRDKQATGRTILNSQEEKNKEEMKQKKYPSEENVILISINSNVVDKVHIQLKSFFPNDKNGLLLELLNGNHIEQKLFFNGSSIKFGDYFSQLHSQNKISNNQTITAQWICKYFLYSRSGSQQNFHFNNVRKILYGQNRISSRKRIIALF